MLRSIVLLVGLVGCGVADPELDITSVALRKCGDPVGCGTNSPIIKVYRTFDFNLDHLKNDDDITYLGMSKGADFYTLEVVGSRMIGTGHKGVIEHDDLVDAKLWVELPDGSTASITITEVSQYPEAVGTHELIETYVLQWAEALHGPTVPMVPGDSFSPDLAEGPMNPVCERIEGDISEELGLRMFESTVFEGDRFDPIAKTVAQMADDRWFNIGCGKHLLAKLRLTRNTINTAKSWQNVQAAMKMFSADYCGDGHPYTVPGTPITFRDQNAMDQYLRLPTEIEARWSENGAICLQTPRLVDRDTVCPTQPPHMAPRPFSFGAFGSASPFPSITPVPTSSIPYCDDLDPNHWAFGDEIVTSAHY